MSDEVERALGRGVRLDAWSSYLPGANALSKTLGQHVNPSDSEGRDGWALPSRSHAEPPSAGAT